MNALEPIFDDVIRNGVGGSVAIIAILAIRALLRRRIPPQLLHVSWLGVALLLLFPAQLTSLFSKPVSEEIARLQSPASLDQPAASIRSPAAVLAAAADNTRALTQYVRAAAPSLAALWGAGALLMLCGIVVSTSVLTRRLKRANRIVDATGLTLLSECEDELKLGRSVHLLECDLSSSPVIGGFLRPAIVFPRQIVSRLTLAEFRWIILHELGHLKRRDHAAHALLLLALAVHWYNPLVWLAFFAARADREAACDKFAVRNASPEEAETYGKTLLRVLRMTRTQAAMLGALGIIESKTEMKHRLDMILDNKPSVLRRAASATLLAAAISAGLATTVLSAQNDASITTTPPAGWFKNGADPGSYVVGVDKTHGCRKPVSAYVKSNGEPRGFGGMMQMASPKDYLGKRVQISAWLKTADVETSAQMWFRVDGPEDKVLAFDNMFNRAPKGTTDWKQYTIVLDVPNDAKALAFGVFLNGKGEVWMNDFQITTVPEATPTTNSEAQARGPQNLDFK